MNFYSRIVDQLKEDLVHLLGASVCVALIVGLLMIGTAFASDSLELGVPCKKCGG